MFCFFFSFFDESDDVRGNKNKLLGPPTMSEGGEREREREREREKRREEKRRETTSCCGCRVCVLFEREKVVVIGVGGWVGGLGWCVFGKGREKRRKKRKKKTTINNKNNNTQKE